MPVLNDINSLRTMPDSERWVWLSMRLDEGDRIAAAQAQRNLEYDAALNAIHKRCAGRRWHGWLLRGLVGAILADVAVRVFGGKP